MNLSNPDTQGAVFSAIKNACGPEAHNVSVDMIQKAFDGKVHVTVNWQTADGAMGSATAAVSPGFMSDDDVIQKLVDAVHLAMKPPQLQ